MAIDLQLYEAISPGWGDAPGTAQRVADAIRGATDADEIALRISSPGGSVFEGFAAYNLLKDSPAKVVVDIDGIAGSIASVIALAGDEVRIAANAMLMIHNLTMQTKGGVATLRQQADLLETLQNASIDVYRAATQRHGQPKTRAQIAKAMSAETWFTANEAKAWGLVTSVTAEQKAAACADLAGFQFQNVPPHLAGKSPAHHEPELIVVRPNVFTELLQQE